MNVLKLTLNCCLFFLAVAASAANEGKEAVVVYNSSAPGSKAVAEYYASRRNVPAAQVFGFAMPTKAEMTRAEYRDSLQKPLVKALAKGKLWRTDAPTGTNQFFFPSGSRRRVVQSSIRYVVLCYGVPYKILPEPELKERGEESLRPELRRNEAAVDSELAWLPLLEPEPMLAGPMANPLAGATNAAALNPTNGILMVARLDGPGVDVAKGLVDKAIEAEQEGFWGRAYFDLRGISDANYKQGDDMLRIAAETCRMLGYETTVDTNAAVFGAGFPMSHIAYYAGWYAESVLGAFARPELEFMPGAFAYHLHSSSASELRSTNHTWVGPLLARGAAASMGSVYEPYLSGTSDMGVFTERFLYAGFSFGEAAYASQPLLSWQTTVVGDPLYRPLLRNLDVLRDELERKGSVLAAWPYLRLVNINLAQGKGLEPVAAFLEDLELRKKSAVLSEKLADIYAAMGKPSSAVEIYERTLKLDPSPQQRLRIRLRLADILTELNREPEAAEQLRRIMQEQPDYPDKTLIESRLTTLDRNQSQTNSVLGPR